MAKKKDCFGSETYVCRTKDCPYVAECVQVVWEKKLRRIVTRRGKSTPLGLAAVRPGEPTGIRVRSRDFLP